MSFGANHSVKSMSLGIKDWNDLAMHARDDDLFPAKVPREELIGQALADHTAMAAGLGAGMQLTGHMAICGALASTVCYAVDVLRKPTNSYPAAERLTIGDILKIAVGPMLAGQVASYSLRPQVISLLRKIHASCESSTNPLLNMSCQTFQGLSVPGSVGIVAGIVSFICKCGLQWQNKKEITLFENGFEAVLNGLLAALMNHYQLGLFTVVGSALVAQALANLKLRAKNCDSNLVSYCASSTYRVITFVPFTLMGWFPKYETYKCYAASECLIIPAELRCRHCAQLLYDAVYVQDHCVCRHCAPAYQKGQGAPPPGIEAAIVPSVELAAVVERYVKTFNVVVVDRVEEAD